MPTCVDNPSYSCAPPPPPNFPPACAVALGNGYCSDYRCLPEGCYPTRLATSSPNHNVNAVDECTARCLDAYGLTTHAIYIRSADGGCSCSSGSCPVAAYPGYQAFSIALCAPPSPPSPPPSSPPPLPPLPCIERKTPLGYCADGRPLPEGFFPARLAASDALHHSDAVVECANRCTHAYSSWAFYLYLGSGCACALGSCPVIAIAGYQAYTVGPCMPPSPPVPPPSPPSPPPSSPPARICEDDPEYSDGGFSCTDWVGYACHTRYAGWTSKPEWTVERMDRLGLSCPTACADVVCPLGVFGLPAWDIPPYPPPSAPMPPFAPFGDAPGWLFSRDALPAAHRHKRPPRRLLHGKTWPIITPISLPGGPLTVGLDATADGQPVTPFHMATNLPLFMPKADQTALVIPKLAAAGVVVWRWPGGAIGDAWCPTTSSDSYKDQCFERWAS